MLINGTPAETIPADDRGLQYGDGLFETIAVRDGEPLLWERHLVRLLEGCERLGIPWPDAVTLRAEADQLCRGTEAAVLKVLVTRGGGGRGYRPPDHPEPRRILSLHPWPKQVAERARHGVRVITCATPLGENPALAGLKHLNRLEQVLAQAEWDDPHIAEGLMANAEGHVVEGTMSNLFAVIQGVLMTPPLARCGVRGVMRGRVMEEARHLDMPVDEAPMDLRAVVGADEVFLTNSVIGLWPVVAVDGRPIGTGAPGIVARRLQEAIAQASGPDGP